MNDALALWPQQASAYAGRVDLLIWAYTAVVVLLTAPVFVLLAVFAIKYRRGRPADRRHRVGGSVLVETSWAVIPFLLTIAFFVYAASLFFQLHRPPANAMVINVVAKQWMWKFQHPEGQREINALHVPVSQPVELVMTSQDVIHSLYLPALRIKQDVLPDRYTKLWFRADRPGVYRLHCAEFCGADHSVMGGVLYILTPADYARWLQRSGVDASLAAQGQALFHSLGCSGCHNPASSVHAPLLEGVYGRPVPLSDGRVVTADDQYIHDSILQPNRDVAAGYAPVMPTFANVVSEDQVSALVAYVKSLPSKPPVRTP
jgi:cytochrome c oxidase subunit 2